MVVAGRQHTNVASVDKALTGVFDDKGEEDTCHQDSRGSSFVIDALKTLIVEHEGCVGIEMDKGRRDDDTRSELLEDEKHGVCFGWEDHL